MPMYFDAYDCEGNTFQLLEYPGGKGIVSGVMQAIKIATSTYIAVDGKVYSSSQAKSKEFSTEANFE
jgi:hypothetical protein